jgi:hypothetical protein
MIFAWNYAFHRTEAGFLEEVSGVANAEFQISAD